MGDKILVIGDLVYRIVREPIAERPAQTVNAGKQARLVETFRHDQVTRSEQPEEDLGGIGNLIACGALLI